MLIERSLHKKIRPFLESKEAVIVTGMRRTGKTSLLRFIYDRLVSQNRLFLDLENPLNQRYFEETNFEKIKFSLELLGLNLTQRAYLFLDEIHLVKNLPRVLKYLIDHYPLKCFLTGSASFYLKNLFTESLVGRKYLFELFPLDFEEFLVFKGSRLRIPAQDVKMNAEIFQTFSPFYDEYLHFGGFPEVVLKTSAEEKRKSLEDIFTSYFQLEVLRFGDYRKNEVIRDLILLLMQRIGSKIDFTKLSSELGVSRITVKEYLSFLEGTYLISLVRPFSKNRDSEIRKMPKVYLCDSGLANHHARIDEGSLFENNIFQSLRGRGKLNYYQRKNGPEIDFVLDQETAIEVKLSATPADVEKLRGLAKELEFKKSVVVSRKFPPHPATLKNIAFGFSI